MKRLVFLVGLGALVILAPSPGFAQVLYEPIYSPSFMLQQNDLKFNPVVNRVINNEAETVEDGVAIAAPANAGVTFTYVHSPQRTQQNLANFVERTPNPGAKSELRAMIAAQPGIMEEIRTSIRPYGLDSHNVADAYALWWINSWLVSEKRHDDADRATIDAVKRQVRAAFAATPDFANTSDAERQEYAEALLLQGVILGTALEQHKGDPATLDQISQAALKGAKASDVDLSRMTLTPNGFVPRSGADASGAIGDNDDPVRNARADAPDEDGSSSGLGMALAAGAGIGLTLLGGLALMRRG